MQLRLLAGAFPLALLLQAAPAAGAQEYLAKELRQHYRGQAFSVKPGYKNSELAFDLTGRLLEQPIQSCRPTRLRIRDAQLTTTEFRLVGFRYPTPAERDLPKDKELRQVIRIRSDGKPWVRESIVAAVWRIVRGESFPEGNAANPEGAQPGPAGNRDIAFVLPDGPVYRIGGEVGHPKRVSTPDPEYSDEARRLTAEGTAFFRLVVEEDGSVSHVRPAGPPLGFGLDEKATAALSAWRFVPFLLNGVPIKVDMGVSTRFCLY